MPRYAEFGSTLISMRHSAGYQHQSDLARRLNVAQQTVSRWEKGTSRPRAEDIPTLAQALGLIDADELLRAAGYQVQSVPSATTIPLQSFPVDTLTPDTFERFSQHFLTNLYRTAEVHRYGAQGHTQEGLDIYVRSQDGTVTTFQCKRQREFGPSDIRAAVLAHTASANKKIILLSRIATPGARNEITRHPDWDIWDKEDISIQIRAHLSAEEQQRLVDAFFPGQRLALIGQRESGPWQTVEEFFAQYEDRRAIFNHAWRLVGRDDIVDTCLSKLALADTKVIALIGAGGSGKSRILLEILRRTPAAFPGTLIRILSPSEDPTSKSLDELGQGEKLLIVDDAHDQEHLRTLFQRVANDPHLKIILCIRPYGQTKIQADASGFALSENRFVEVDIKPLKIAQVTELAYEALEPHGLSKNDAESIARLTYDCPLATVISTHLIASKQIPIGLVANQTAFRTELLARFRDVIAGELGGPSEAELYRKILRLVAFLQPIAIDGSTITRVAKSLENISHHDTRRVLGILAASGVLFRRGRHYRLSPDLLADFIIQEACISADGHSLGYAERVFAATPRENIEHLITNLSKLDWRLSKTDTSGSRVLDGVWGQLEGRAREGASMMQAISAAALYQPERSLAFAIQCIRARKIPQGLSRMLRNVAFHIDHLKDACECLWEMGRGDDRLLGQHPEHAMRVLAELCEVEPRKPIAFNEVIIDFGLSLLPHPSAWTGAYSPLDFLSGILKTDGHTTATRGDTMHFTPYFINAQAVHTLREKVIESTLVLLEHDDLSIAARAVKFLSGALRYPMGVFGAKPSSETYAQWTQEFQETLAKIKAITDRRQLPDIIHLELAKIVSWCAHYGPDGVRSPALAIIETLPDSLAFRLTQALMSGWRKIRLADDPISNERAWMKMLEELAQELLSQSTPSDLLIEINARLNALATAKLDDGAQPIPLLHQLFPQSLALAQATVEQALEEPDAPLSRFVDIALANVLRSKHDVGFDLVQRLWANGSDLLRNVVASAYASYNPVENFSQEELIFLARVFQHGPTRAAQIALGAMPALVRSNRAAAVDIFKQLELSTSTEFTEEALALLRSDGPLPLRSLEEDDIQAILNRLLPLGDLDGYWIQAMLADLSSTRPSLILAFFIDRLNYATTLDDWSYRVSWMHIHRNVDLNLRTHLDARECIAQLLYWMQDHADDLNILNEAGRVFAALFSPIDSSILDAIHQILLLQPTAQSMQTLIAIAQHVGNRFVFEQRDFVAYALDLAESIERELADRLVSALFAATINGTSVAVPGHPSSNEVKLLQESGEVLAGLSKFSASYPLYDGLRRHAQQGIGMAQSVRQSLEDDDED